MYEDDFHISGVETEALGGEPGRVAEHAEELLGQGAVVSGGHQKAHGVLD